MFIHVQLNTTILFIDFSYIVLLDKRSAQCRTLGNRVYLCDVVRMEMYTAGRAVILFIHVQIRCLC
jgi:hypothetical protein